ncbi:MAG: putative metal-dependent hydrolase [Ignavibacteriae bacterium]|nr:putative metal-dependent hydrolase [Ignavibacteriota bacterium]
MITSPEIRALIDEIRFLPEAISQAIRNLDDVKLDKPYRKGGWTVRQVVHHLADSHINAYIRMKLILTEDKPTLKPYDQDLWAALPDSKYLSLESSLLILRGVHFRWTVLLDSLTDDAIIRTGLHPEIGEVTLGNMIETYSRHGMNHIMQITDLRERMGWND